MPKSTLCRLAIAAGIMLQLGAIGTANARFLRPPPVMIPVPVHGGGPDLKMKDMDIESCLHESTYEYLCTGKDGFSYGCTYNPGQGIDRCQRL